MSSQTSHSRTSQRAHSFWLLALLAVVLTAVVGAPQAFAATASPGAHALVDPGARALRALYHHSTPLLPPCQQLDRCYTPRQIASAYHALFQQGITGRGQTIVVVIAGQDPTLLQDLHAFSQTFGLPDPPSVQVYYPQGKGQPSAGLSTEVAIDTEWSHAMAPGASLAVVLANIDADTTIAQIVESLNNAAGYAIDHHLGEVVSLSYGIAEPCLPPDAVARERAMMSEAADTHITVLAAAGDTGSTQYTCDASTFFSTATVALPASDPQVTAVGGTHLNADLHGNYLSEQGWSFEGTPQHNHGAGGGGFSSLYPTPTYQIGVHGIGSQRALPDVSLDADPTRGLLVLCTYCNNGVQVIFSIGGTSVSTPAWAGIVADANQ